MLQELSFQNEEELNKINRELCLLFAKKIQLYNLIFELEKKLKVEKSKEYLLHGVGRRISTITRCIENIFSIFPANQNDILESQKIGDVTINLHAFVINISGALDNIALVLYYEKKPKIKRIDVSFFKKEFIKRLKDGSFKEYLEYLESLKSKKENWYFDYLKNYRDALCHRIPLYIPPYVQDSKTLKKSPGFFIKHSLANAKDDKNEEMLFHAQILTDFNTLEEFIKKFCENFDEIEFLPEQPLVQAIT